MSEKPSIPDGANEVRPGSTFLPCPRKLLIIDDDLEILEVLRIIHAHPDVSIETASDGALGLAKARQWQPHVIILDKHLPSKSGFEVAKELRAASFSPRIIITSALPWFEFFRTAIELGAYDVLEKPFDIDRARTVVFRALEVKATPLGPHGS